MPPRSRVTALLVLLTAAFGVGCDEAVDPTLDGGAQFTLFGALDPNAPQQSIRVFPIRDTIGPVDAGSFEATLRSVDLQTGEERIWRDTTIVLTTGVANVFISDFAPAFGHTYEIEAAGPSGPAASAVVDVPPLIEPILRFPTFGSEGAAQEVFWPGAARLNSARVTLRLISSSCQRFTYQAREGGAAPLDFGWVVRVPFGQLSSDVATDVGVPAGQLSILEAIVEAEVANAAWVPPGGVFDAEVLIEPGTFSNVANGFGFVGAKYPSSLRWQPTSQLASRAGFRPLNFGECP